MSFCCGASMIGTKGTVKHVQTRIHNVPLLFCPVCHRTEIHFQVKDEYEILVEYANGDGAIEVDFADYVDEDEQQKLFENCISHDAMNPLETVSLQIDMALDLMIIARTIEDQEWEVQLKKRLKVMSERMQRLRTKMTAGK